MSVKYNCLKSSCSGWIMGICLTAVIALVLGACSSEAEKAKPKKPAPKTTQQQPAPAQETPQQPTRQDSLPEVVLPQLEERQSRPSLFSITVNNMDIREVLQIFARDSQISLVVDPDVKGRVTVDLKAVTFDTAMHYLLDPLDMEWVREGNVVRISKRRMKTRIFKVSYPAGKRTSKGGISLKGLSDKLGATGEITTENETDFWKDLEEKLGQLINAMEANNATPKASAEGGSEGVTVAGAGAGAIGNSPQASLVIDKTAGIVLVTASHKTMQTVEQFIDIVTDFNKTQVNITAKILEIELDDNSEYGINWDRASDRVFGADLALSGQQPVTGAFLTGTFSSDKTNAVLSALEKEGKINTISSPNISTMNGQSAIMKVATEEVAYSITREEDGDEVTVTVDFKKVDVGLSLHVTPRVDEHGVIMMQVHPVITELIEFQEVTDTAGTVIAVEPVMDVRELDVMVQARDGQTVVLAGLMRNNEEVTETGVPLLKDVPIIGNAFKHTQKTKKKTELVIFLTPKVINDSTFNNTIKQGEEHWNKYGNFTF